MKLSRSREGKKQNLKPTIFTLENQVANLTATYDLPILMRLMNSKDTKASWSHNSKESTFIKDFMWCKPACVKKKKVGCLAFSMDMVLDFNF